MSLFHILNSDEQESNSSIDDPTRSEVDEDHISKLPDDVLRQILLIHPLSCGSKTVALLTGLWDRPWITTLKIQDFEFALGDFIVKYGGDHHLKTPRKREFHLSKDLIITASIGIDRKLNLDFSKVNQELPKFRGENVLSTQNLFHASSYMFSISTLKLIGVNNLSCEFVSSLFINKFHGVENLIIEKCDGLRSLRVEGLSKLRSLSVFDCVNLESVNVEAPKLISLRYSGFLCRLSWKQVTSLKDIKLDIKGRGLNPRLFSVLMQIVQDATTLKLYGWLVKEIFGPLLSLKDLQFSKLEDLFWIDSGVEDHNFNLLIDFLRHCTSLKRLLIRIDSGSDSKPCVDEHESYTTKVQQGGLRNLKVVKMIGFENELDILLFKERLMQVFNAEPRIVEVRKGMHDRCLLRYTNKHKVCGKVKSEKLRFSYRFVEDV